MHLFGSRGHPESARKMTGFGIHTFKLVSEDGSFRYCKFHFKPVQGISNISSDMATRLAGTNPDSYNQDLWEAIARGDHPVWKLYVQVMEPERAETFGRALFDITKVWPHKDFPLIEVGEMTLNRNVRCPFCLVHHFREIADHSCTARELLRRDRTGGFLSLQPGPRCGCHS